MKRGDIIKLRQALHTFVKHKEILAQQYLEILSELSFETAESLSKDLDNL